jgi:hypothetical protein
MIDITTDKRKSMNTKTAITLLTSFVLLSCSESLQIYSDRDRKIDLSKYKSYAWIAPGDTVLNKKRTDKFYGDLITYTSDTELKKKGMTVDVSTPDALFMFDTRLQERVQYTQSSSVSVGFGYGGPGYYVGGAVPVAGGDLKANVVEEGLLFINMYDTKTGKLIWSGGASKQLSASTDVDRVVKNAVKQIFTRLPIRHKKK